MSWEEESTMGGMSHHSTYLPQRLLHAEMLPPPCLPRVWASHCRAHASFLAAVTAVGAWEGAFHTLTRRSHDDDENSFCSFQETKTRPARAAIYVVGALLILEREAHAMRGIECLLQSGDAEVRLQGPHDESLLVFSSPLHRVLDELRRQAKPLFGVHYAAATKLKVRCFDGLRGCLLKPESVFLHFQEAEVSVVFPLGSSMWLIQPELLRGLALHVNEEGVCSVS
jgi:hypothetical protein